VFAAPSDDDGHHAGQQSRVAQGETSNSPRGSTNSGTMMAVSTTDATKGAVILEVAPVDRPRPHASQRCARPMPREPEFAREPELEHEPRWRAVSGSLARLRCDGNLSPRTSYGPPRSARLVQAVTDRSRVRSRLNNVLVAVEFGPPRSTTG
jgi:hypothetical protein